MERHIYEKLEVPNVPDNEARSHEMLDLTQAEATLRYLKTYEYATRRHAMFYTLWHTGCRVSGAMALDVSDVAKESGDYIIKFRNRRSTGTGLKNGDNGERNVSITESLWDVLQDYLEGPHRDQVEDEYGREPLFTTPGGRISRQSAYKDYTAITRPCVTTNSCPHNRVIDECEAAQRKKQAMKCPSSLSLHPIRRGAITYQINRGWPKEKLSERTDVSVEVLEKHYDARTQEEQREGRKQHLDLLE
jgi:integrase